MSGLSVRLAAALAAASLVFFATPRPANAQGLEQVCFCCTPGGAGATGSTTSGQQSAVKIKWGTQAGPNGNGWFTYNPSPGDSCTTIMTNLRTQMMGALPGNTFGPVTTDANGRAVFCVSGPRPPGILSVTTREDDTGIREVTYAIVRAANNPFLRGVVGAFIAPALGMGGQIDLKVDVEKKTGVSTTAVSIRTNPGDTPHAVNNQILAALNAQGLQAFLGQAELDEGVQLPAIIVKPGQFLSVNGIGITSTDPGFAELAVGGAQFKLSVPVLSRWGLGCLALALVGLAAFVIVRLRGGS